MTANDSPAPEKLEPKCAKCGHSEDDHDGYGGMCDGLGYNESRTVCGCQEFTSPSDPPVGKDSSFEELLDAYRDALALPLGTDSESEFGVYVIAAARAALEKYVAKLQAFSRTAYLSANRELEAKLAASYLAIERRDAQVASLQSEIERQREETEERVEAAIHARDKDFDAINDHRLELLERQRETTLTQEEWALIGKVELEHDQFCGAWNNYPHDCDCTWRKHNEAVAKLNEKIRLLSSSPLT